MEREQAKPGLVCIDAEGYRLRLDHQVPGDSWEWSCDVWIEGSPGVPGYEEGRWSAEECRVHISELAIEAEARS